MNNPGFKHTVRITAVAPPQISGGGRVAPPRLATLPPHDIWGGGEANIFDGGGGGKYFPGVDGGRVQGVPEFPENGGKYYLPHGGDPPPTPHPKYHGYTVG